VKHEIDSVEAVGQSKQRTTGEEPLGRLIRVTTPLDKSSRFLFKESSRHPRCLSLIATSKQDGDSTKLERIDHIAALGLQSSSSCKQQPFVPETMREKIMARMTEHVDEREKDLNQDPLTGEPGAHPVGTGIGAVAAGAAAGAAGGAVAGPAGAVAGAVVGAVAGGYAGKEAAEAIDPTVEDAYWRSHYTTRPYYEKSVAYDEYQPAYRYGWETRSRYQNRPFNEVESELERGWESAKENSKLAWSHARNAARDAWDRIDNSRANEGSSSR
jgi:hypothetical protein